MFRMGGNTGKAIESRQRVNKCRLGANAKGDGFGSVNHFRKVTKKGQKKSTVATMGGFCGRGIKKYPFEGVKGLEGGQLFR